MTEKNKKLLIILLSALAIALAAALIIVLVVQPGANGPATDDTPQPEEGIYYFDSGIQEYTLTLSRGHRFTLFVKGGTESGAYSLDGTQLVLDFSAEGLENITATLENDVVTLTYQGATMRFLKKLSYTVQFETNGGQAMEPVSVLNGQTLAKPADPVREGFVFVGWYTDSAFAEPFAFDGQVVTADLTLYARWSEDALSGVEYTVELDPNYEGAEKLDSLQTLGGRLFALPTLTRDGYSFCGWWISMVNDGQRLSYMYNEGMVLENHTTLYALWQSNDIGSKLPDPLASVAAGSVSWNAVPNARSYTISVINADGVALIDNESTGATTFNIPFDTYDAGLYEVRITALANTGEGDNSKTVRYYNNKALGQVSAFAVIDSMLIFNTVEHAQKYLITVTCGNPEHNHTLFDNGNSRTFNFANCEMLPGGIRFKVTAVAEDYASTTSREFVYCRDLPAVEGLRYDEKTQSVIWNAVADAADYMVSVECGNAAHDHSFHSNLGRTQVSLKECDAREGGIVVKVYPKTWGYNSSEAVQITVNKTGPATPGNVRLNGAVLNWSAVSGAQKYELLVGDKTVTVSETTCDLTELVEWVEGAVYTVRIRAIGEGESAWSEDITVRCRQMGQNLHYGQSVLSWQPVLGATGYEVQINDGEIITVEDGSTSLKIQLTQPGVNLLKVRYMDGNSRSDWAQTEVFAHTVVFDSRGGSQIEVQYKAVGDLTELPATEKAGYTFAAWYNVPGGPAANGRAYNDTYFAEPGDLVLYAHYTPNTYQVIYNYGDGGSAEPTSGTAAYERHYQLVVPTPNSPVSAFGGWFGAPYGMGVQYTDPKGNSLQPWSADEDTKVYAFWIDSALEFTQTKHNGEDVYMVAAGSQIALLQEVTVPATYNGLPVAMVAGNGFKDCTSLKIINLPATLQQISLINPFAGCSNLEAVNVYQVEGSKAERYWSADGVLFDNGTGDVAVPKLLLMPLSKTGSYRIPSSVTEIPERAFSGSALTRIQIPASITRIGNEAFKDCHKLTDVVFETAQNAKSLSIGTRVFSGCTALQKIVLPARLGSINLNRYELSDHGINLETPGDAFQGCTALTNITVAQGGAAYKSVDGVIYSGDGKTLLYYPATKEGVFTVPYGTIAIEPGAFIGCTKLTEITIPNTVTLVAEGAFYGLDLTKVTFGGNSYNNTTIDQYAFAHCTALQQVVFESGSRVTALGDQAFQNCSALETFHIPASMTKIGVEAFSGCTGLTSITFAANGKTLAFGENVFYGCVSLATVDLPANVSEIPGIFGGCVSLQAVNVAEDSPYLTSVDGVVFNKEQTEVLFFPHGKTGEYALPSTVTTIANGVFAGITGLKKLTIPVAITTIGDNAFRDSAIKEIAFARGLARWELTIGASAFEGADLGKLTLPAHTRVIGQRAFANATYDAITLNEGIHTLGAYAFYLAGGSKVVTIPASVKTIGEHCFEASTGWDTVGTAVELNDRNSVLETIGDYAFANNTKITSIRIPNTVTEIGTRAFSQCKSLKSITFQENSQLRSIGARAFEYCGTNYGTELTTITIPKSVTSLGSYAFYNCNNLETVLFEEGGTEDLVIGEVFLYASTGLEGQTVRTIEHGHVFENCGDLRVVQLPDRLVEIGPYCFQYAANYSDAGLEITLGENSRLATIGEYAFYGCNLNSITIPKSVRNLEPYVNDQLDYSYDRMGIGAFAFAGNYDTLSSVTFVLGGTEPLTIGANAFDNAKLLTEIELPNRLASYTSYTGEVLTPFANGAGVFNDAINLECITIEAGGNGYVDVDGVVYTADMTELVICPASKTGAVEVPGSVTRIHNRAFYTCEKLEAVTFVGGSAPMTIGDEAFRYCSRITELRLPTNVSWLGKSVFAASSSSGSALQSITLSKNLENFDGYMIANCYNLQTIHVEAGSNFFSSENGVLFDAQKTKLVCYPMAREDASYTLPETVTEICTTAFGGHPSLQTVILPASLQIIGDYAFADCTALRTVCIPNSVEKIGDRAFSGCYSLTELSFQQSGNTPLVVGAYAFYNISAEELELPAHLSVLSSYAFYNARIRSLRFAGPGLQKIGDNAFQNTLLVNVILPDGVVTIGSNVFKGCGVLKSVLFGEGLTSIGGSVFESSSVENVSFPASLGSMGNRCFYNCNKLENVSFAAFAQLAVLPAGTFAQSALEQFTVPAGVKEIADAGTVGGVFQACTNLRQVLFAEGSTCKYIGDKAFYDCSALDGIAIPVTVGTLGTSAFEGCSALTSIVVPANTTQLGSNTFASCYSLAEVVLNTKTTALPGWMFANCAALKHVQIPASVSSIGDRCFVNSGVQSLSVAPGSTSLAAVDGVVYNASMTQLLVYPEQKQDMRFVVPASVTYVGTGVLNDNTYLFELVFEEGTAQLNFGEKAFARMSNLRSVALPERLRTIGTEAFYYCSNLMFVNIPASAEKDTFGENCFVGCGKLMEVYNASALEIKAGSEDFGGVAMNALNVYTPTSGESKMRTDEQGYITFLEETDNGTRVHLVAYNGRETALVLPEGITDIYANTFYDAALTSVTIPEGVRHVGAAAFYNCDELQEVVLPSTLESIGEEAFFSCNSLIQVAIPKSVTRMDYAAFRYCYTTLFLMEHTSQPAQWNTYWVTDSCSIIWGYDGQEHTYTFKSNGGPAVEPIRSKIAVELPELTRPGYVFMGWYDNAKFEGKELSGAYYSVSKNTLYAKWLTQAEYDAQAGTSFEQAIKLQMDVPVTITIDAPGEVVYLVYTNPGSTVYGHMDCDVPGVSVDLYEGEEHKAAGSWKISETGVTFFLKDGVSYFAVRLSDATAVGTITFTLTTY